MSEISIGIECCHRYGDAVYGDDFHAHFPDWIRWRRRLRECFGRERTDWQLWEDWIGYSQEYQGIDKEQFLGTLRSAAEALLPPLPGVERTLVRAGEDGEQVESPDSDTTEFERLEVLTPKLDVESVDWIETNRRNYGVFGIYPGTLRKYRETTNAQYVAPDQMFGVDRDGRIWRRKPGNKKPQDGRVFYLRSSLSKA